MPGDECQRGRLTKGTEDDEGKGVADDPFADSTKDHKDTAKEEEYTYMVRSSALVLASGRGEICPPVEAAPLPPAPRQPMRSHERGVKLNKKPTRALPARQRHPIAPTKQRCPTLAWDSRMSFEGRP